MPITIRMKTWVIAAHWAAAALLFALSASMGFRFQLMTGPILLVLLAINATVAPAFVFDGQSLAMRMFGLTIRRFPADALRVERGAERASIWATTRSGRERALIAVPSLVYEEAGTAALARVIEGGQASGEMGAGKTGAGKTGASETGD